MKTMSNDAGIVQEKRKRQRPNGAEIAELRGQIQTLAHQRVLDGEIMMRIKERIKLLDRDLEFFDAHPWRNLWRYYMGSRPQ